MDLGQVIQWLTLAGIPVGACIWLVKHTAKFVSIFNEYKTNSILEQQKTILLVHTIESRQEAHEKICREDKKILREELKSDFRELHKRIDEIKK